MKILKKVAATLVASVVIAIAASMPVVAGTTVFERVDVGKGAPYYALGVCTGNGWECYLFGVDPKFKSQPSDYEFGRKIATLAPGLDFYLYGAVAQGETYAEPYLSYSRGIGKNIKLKFDVSAYVPLGRGSYQVYSSGLRVLYAPPGTKRFDVGLCATTAHVGHGDWPVRLGPIVHFPVGNMDVEFRAFPERLAPVGRPNTSFRLQVTQHL